MANNRGLQQFKDETGFSDPLSECENFNLLQFINSNDTPVDSPAPFAYPQMSHAPPPQQRAGHSQQQQQQQQQQQPQQPPQQQQQPPQQQARHVQQPVCLDNAMMAGYPGQASRLPDSPPITDVSAGGSSGSPSSDAPYSPDQYPQYQFQAHRASLPLHMSLDLHQQQHQHHHQQQQQHHQQQQMGRGRAPLQQTQVSPNSDFLSPYPPQTPPAQVSPQQPLGQRAFLQQQQQQQQQQQMAGFPMEMYLNENDAGDFQGILECAPPHNGAKRRRYDGTLVKNEQFVQPPAAQTPLPAMSCGGGMLGSMSSASPNSGSLDDFDDCNHQRTIKFQAFEQPNWAHLFDERRQPMHHLAVNVVADKGFNFSSSDGCFVNQKKNHFQITCHVDVKEPPAFVNLGGQLKPVQAFRIVFCGAKSEMPTSEIQIRQSQTDRKPVKHEAEELLLEPHKVAKKTVPRLHFSETTLNNHRKNGRPNPDQKFFLLVVKFLAVVEGQPLLMQAYCSDRVIVRASNPGQFEPPENDVSWQRNGSTLHYAGPVAVGTEKPMDNAQLTVMGNIVSTGASTRPSDRRVKEDIVAVDRADALKHIGDIRVVEYAYKPELAQQWGLSEADRRRVGVIAQELADVLPDAVKENGELYTVDETRIFYEGFVAAQELGRLYGHLDGRVDRVQQIAEILAREAKRRRRLGGSVASGLTGLTQLISKDGQLLDGFDEEEEGEEGDHKFLTHSRLSISSLSPSVDASASQVGSASQLGRRKHRKPKHAAGGHEPPLCGSKMTQGTMIVLVFIMSLCLVTMCTLYVLDWYNRTYVYTPHSFPRNPPTTPPVLMDNIVDLTNKEWSPPLQTLVHPLLSACALGGAACPTYCCGAAALYNATDARPAAVDAFVSLPRPAAALEQRLPAAAVAAQADGPPRPFPNGVTLRLVDLNVTLDERHCVEGSCNARKGRYNLYVPVSAYMPTVSLQVQLSVDPGMIIDNCGALRGFKHKSCEFESETNDEETEASPTMYKMDAHNFQLSAGDFMQSAYRFRVGHSSLSCQMGEDQQGRSFDEFNLVFYRQCA